MPKKPKRELSHTSVRIPKEIADKLDSLVDRIKYRSRGHLVTVILHEWFEKEIKFKDLQKVKG